MLDEPTTSLHPLDVDKLMAQLRDLGKKPVQACLGAVAEDYDHGLRAGAIPGRGGSARGLETRRARGLTVHFSEEVT